MSTRYEMLSRLEQVIEYGKQRREGRRPTPPAARLREGFRIAIIGGTEWNDSALRSFLKKLHEKYPQAIIVTGNGRGAEPVVADIMRGYGHYVEIPAVWLTSDCQVNDILWGAEVIVVVGDPGGSRAKLAWEIHARLSYKKTSKGLVKYKGKPVTFLDGEVRPFYNIAKPSKAPKATKKRAVSKAQKEARETKDG